MYGMVWEGGGNELSTYRPKSDMELEIMNERDAGYLVDK